MTDRQREQDARQAADPKKLKGDPKPGHPKRANRDFVDSGKHDNKDTRRELRTKH